MNGEQKPEVPVSNPASAEPEASSNNNANLNSSGKSHISQILQYILSIDPRSAILSNRAEQQQSEIGDYSLSIRDRSLSEGAYKNKKKRKQTQMQTQAQAQAQSQPQQQQLAVQQQQALPPAMFVTQRIENEDTKKEQFDEIQLDEESLKPQEEEVNNPELEAQISQIEEQHHIQEQLNTKGRKRERGERAPTAQAADSQSNIFKIGIESEASPGKRSGRGRPPRNSTGRCQIKTIQDMAKLIETGFKKQRSLNIQPVFNAAFVKRQFIATVNLSRGLPVIQYMIQLLDVGITICAQYSDKNPPVSAESYKEMLNQLLDLEMLDIKNVTNQDCGFKADAQKSIQNLLEAIYDILQFLTDYLKLQKTIDEKKDRQQICRINFNSKDTTNLQENQGLEEDTMKKEDQLQLEYTTCTLFNMYTFLFDELNKLWDAQPIKQSELIRQIKQIRRLISVFLGIPEQHMPHKKRRSKRKSEMIQQLQQQQIMSSEQSRESSPKEHKIFMTEKVDRTPPEATSSPRQLKVNLSFKDEDLEEPQPIVVAPLPLPLSLQQTPLPIQQVPKKFVLSIDLKKDTDEEEDFEVELPKVVDPIEMGKRESRSRTCKEKSQKKEDETESEEQSQAVVLKKREILKVDINPAPTKIQKLTKRQNQLVKNKTPVQDFNILDLKLGPNSQYQLVQCETYESFETQPYRIYFTFEVQMLMYIHSYLSKHEVIGLLGGITYQSMESGKPVKYLVISKIYTAESCIESQTVRLKNCEISDAEQIKIQDQMDKDGVQKLAWYHSHPIFEVDPSIQDLVTHYSQQVNYDREGLPFFGVIVGPYLQKQDVTETQLTVFNLREDYKNLSAQRQALQNLKDRARQFKYKIIPKTKLKYSMYSDIKKMIKTSSTHKCDKPDLCSEWTKQRSKQKYSFKDKFMLSLKKVCENNYQQQESFDLISEIRDKLNSEDQNTLDQQLSSNDVVAPFQIIQRQQLQMQQATAEFQHQALLQKHQKTKYFSIGDSKKICKYLTKIEQALIKEFGLETQNLMEQTYLNQKQKEIEEQEVMQKMKNDEKVIYISELRTRQVKKYSFFSGEQQQMQGQGMQKIQISQTEEAGDEENQEANDEDGSYSHKRF